MYDKNQIENSLEFVRQLKDFYESEELLSDFDPLEGNGDDELFANLANNLEQNDRPWEKVLEETTPTGAGFDYTKQQEAQKQIEEERRQLEEERKRLEEERRQREQEEKRRQEAERKQIEEERRRLQEEQDRLERERRLQEEIEERRRQEAAMKQIEEERKRIQEEQKAAERRAAEQREAQRRAEEEEKRRRQIEEERRKQQEEEENRRIQALEERRKQQEEEENRRIQALEERRKQQEEEERRRMQAMEERRRQQELEEQRRQEALRKQLEEERRRLAEEQRAAEQRLAAERKAAEEERKRIEAERQRLAEERRQREAEEQKRLLAEQKRKEEERKRREAEEQKRRRDLVLAEQKRLQQIKEEEERQQAEKQKQQEEAAKLALAEKQQAEAVKQEDAAMVPPLINMPGAAGAPSAANLATGAASVGTAPVGNTEAGHVPAGDTEVTRLQKRAEELQRQAEMATLEARMRQLQLESQAAQGIIPQPNLNLPGTEKSGEIPFAKLSIPGMDSSSSGGADKTAKSDIDSIFAKELEKFQDDQENSASHHRADHPMQKYFNNFDGKTLSSLIPAEKIMDIGYKVKDVVDDQVWNIKHFIQKKIGNPDDGEAQEKTKKLITNIIVIAICVVCAYLLANGITHFVAHPTKVEGESMETTLTNGDTVVIQKVSYYFGHPERYDVVVFPVPNYNSSTFYIKRVIGLPGETVQIKEGKVYINGEELITDKYGKDEFIDDPGDAVEPIVLAKGEYFVLGDNRNMSTDSRSSYVGMVNERYIVGKAWERIWPLSKFGPVRK